MESSHSNERKIENLIELSTTLQTVLASHISDHDILLGHVETGLHTATFCISAPTIISSRTLKKLEAHSRVLWKLCVRRRRDMKKETSASNMQRLVLHSWLLAFLLFHLSRLGVTTGGNSVFEAEYLLELVLPVTAASMNDSELGVARLAMQRGATYVNILESTPNTRDCRNPQATRLQVAYYSLRILLSWKEDRLDVAEHMFSKIDPIRRDLDDSSVENLANILQNVGTDLISKQNLESGLNWLRRGHHLLSSKTGILSPKAKHLHLAICNEIMQAITKSNLKESIGEARSILDSALSRIGDHPVLLHWQLVIFHVTDECGFSEEAHASIIQRMILSPGFSENTFHLALAHLVRLGNKCSPSELLDELLFRHALPGENAIWLGKVVFLRIWTTFNMIYSHEEYRKLGDVVEKVHQSIRRHLSWVEVEACQALIWKGTESLFSARRYEEVEFWCHLALSPLFRMNDTSGLGRFVRRLIICGIKRNNVQEVYESLNDLLYACFSEAQNAGDKMCALEALRAIFEQLSEGFPPSINVPLLLRSALRMMETPDMNHHELGGYYNKSQFVEDICYIFEIAAKYAKPRQEAIKSFPISELDWFRKNAYNIAILKCHEWQEDNIIRLSSSCISFVSCYPSTISTHQANELASTLLRCHFLISVCLLKQAQRCKDLPKMHHCYAEIRHHTTEYKNIFHSSRITDIILHQDLASKMTTLLVYDFEAAISLGQFEDLQTIIGNAKLYKDIQAFKCLGDILLQCPIPAQVLTTTLKAIINEIHRLEQFNAAKLCRYLRIILQTTVSVNDTAALQIIGQIIKVAHESREAGTLLPRADLEWIAAVTFNHAIDYYALSEETSCRVWAAKSMELAECLNDRGRLAKILRDRFGQLRFESEIYSWQVDKAAS